MIKVGFTGTQRGMTPAQQRAVRDVLGAYLEKVEFHHGDCVGADLEAHHIAQSFGHRVIIHPPENPRKRAYAPDPYETLDPKPYLARNHDIVDATYVLIATPATTEEIVHSGTWATIRYARKHGKAVLLFLPNTKQVKRLKRTAT